jgi:glycosyltransferase involved in cell wall biosynthesis
MSNHSNPLLSVIIPTRERAETLQYTLRTALDQTSKNFEVIVSDNFSQDNTAEVVRSLSDPRVRLINPGRRLSMCDNWDFALLHAAGEYIMFVGDDDAVIPGAIDKLEVSIRATHCLAYRWPRPVYIWPMDGKPARVVELPATTQASEINLENLARLVVSMGGWRYPLIPCMYHSAVAKRIPDSIREKTGRVFHSMAPDLFMSMAVPVFAKTAIDLGYSVSVVGHSEKSNGGTSDWRDRLVILDRFIREYGDYKIHPTLFPEIPAGVNLIPDSLLVAMDKFPDFYGGMKFNYDAMWALLFRPGSVMFAYGLRRLDIIRKRRQIRRYHPFDVSRFLLYSAFNQTLELRRRVRSRILRFRGLAKHPPDNIRDFVKSLPLASPRQNASGCTSTGRIRDAGNDVP